MANPTQQKKIIDTIEEVKQFVPSNLTSDFDVISTYIDQAELDYVKPIIGEDLIELLEVYKTSGQEGTSPVTDKLMKLVRRVMSNFAYYIAIPMLDVIASDNGFIVVTSQNEAPASKARVENLRKGLQSLGYRSQESLLQYLEDNEDSFPEWKTSDAYTRQTEFLINSAKELQLYIDINTSRLKFISLKPLIRNAEEMFIRQAISVDLYERIKEEIEIGLSPAIKAIILPLKSALAWYIAAQDKELFDKYPNANYQATNNLTLVINTMLANIDNYPEYRDSNLYDDSEPFANEENNNFFVA